jgi:hypothetical protein
MTVVGVPGFGGALKVQNFYSDVVLGQGIHIHLVNVFLLYGFRPLDASPTGQTLGTLAELISEFGAFLPRTISLD